MKILETELEFEFSDADDMEKLEKAIDITQEELMKIEIKNKKNSEIIRETCNCIFNCFNQTFGEGSDKKIFGEKTNFKLCLQAFKDLCEARIKEEEEFKDVVNDMENKYTPNRAQRRNLKQ
ncbi:MAG: DUF6673 family protein [Clostridia bacterium]